MSAVEETVFGHADWIGLHSEAIYRSDFPLYEVPNVNTVLLLVTWFVYGHGPSSYQIQFTSLEACQNARLAVMAENQRLRSENDGRSTPGQVPGFNRTTEAAPFVSAICAKL